MDIMKHLRGKPKEENKGLSPETVMAAASLMNRSGKPKKEQEDVQDEMQIMLAKYLGPILRNEAERIDKDKAKALEFNESSRKLAETAAHHKNLEQDMCSHKKQDGRSRIGGQYLSNGTFMAICTWCQKHWSLPADNATFPKELMPSPEIIGGASAGMGG